MRCVSWRSIFGRHEPRPRTLQSERSRTLSALALCILGFPAGALADDLLAVYRQARDYDARWRSANAAYRAGLEKLPQGRSLLLPSLALKGQKIYTDGDIEYLDPSPFTSGERDYDFGEYGVDLTQPLYRKESFALYGKAKAHVGLVEADFRAAQVDLIERVADSYFEMLFAQHDVRLSEAETASFKSQWERARERHRAGIATLLDVYETQAKYDLAVSNELKARKELDIKRESLRKLLGHVPAELAELTPQPTLPTVRPETADEWVAIAEKHNPQLASVRFAAEEAEQELQRARGSHHPTVDFVAGYSMTRTTGSVYTDSASRAELYSYGVQVEVPLYKGGALDSQVREAASLRDKAKEDLEEVRRTVALETRQAFLEVTHSLAEMKAMEQALRSAELQLSSTKSGLNAGVRTTTDLLQAEQQVFAAKRDLARARYAYCTKIVQLHAAAGTADEEILAVINALLVGAQGTASKT